MVVVMTPAASSEDVDAVIARVTAAGGSAFVSRGVTRTIIGLVGDLEQFRTLNLRAMAGVSDVVRVSQPYKLVSRDNHPDMTTVYVGGVPIGPDTFTLIAGPCAVETPGQTLEAAEMAKAAGATLLRGGCLQAAHVAVRLPGPRAAGLEILADVREATGMPVVTEVVDAHDVDVVASYADMLQVGTRNMANFALLQAVGAAGRPSCSSAACSRPSRSGSWRRSTSPSAATSTSCSASGASGPSRRRRATRSTSARCRSCTGSATCR
jgi:3-deoxy-7-phosphoheptulonate synthase